MNILPGASRKWKVLDREPEYQCIIDPPEPCAMKSVTWSCPLPYDCISFNFSKTGHTELLGIVRDPVQSGLVMRLHSTHWINRFFFK